MIVSFVKPAFRPGLEVGGGAGWPQNVMLAQKDSRVVVARK